MCELCDDEFDGDAAEMSPEVEEFIMNSLIELFNVVPPIPLWINQGDATMLVAGDFDGFLVIDESGSTSWDVSRTEESIRDFNEVVLPALRSGKEELMKISGASMSRVLDEVEAGVNGRPGDPDALHEFTESLLPSGLSETGRVIIDFGETHGDLLDRQEL